MQLRHVLETELDPWGAVDTAWDEDLWEDEVFDSTSAPGSDDELEAAERWLEAHPLDDDASTDASADGQAMAVDLSQGFH